MSSPKSSSTVSKKTAAKSIKSAKKSNIVLIVAGLFIFLLTSCGVGGYLFYSQWYIPQVIKQYVVLLDSQNSLINETVSTVEEDIKDNYDADLQGIDSKGTSPEYSYNLAQGLVVASSQAEEKIPLYMPEGESLQAATVLYYQQSRSLGEEYGELSEFFKEADPAISDVQEAGEELGGYILKSNSPTALRNSAKKIKNTADDVEKANIELKKLETNQDTEEAQKIVTEYLEAAVVYLRASAKALNQLAAAWDKANRAISSLSISLAEQAESDADKAESQYKKAEKKYKTAEKKYIKEVKDYDKKTRTNYLAKVDETNSCYDNTNNEIEVLKEKYNISSD